MVTCGEIAAFNASTETSNSFSEWFDLSFVQTILRVQERRDSCC